MRTEEKVIDNYLVWELCKQQDIKRKIIDGSPDGEELKKEIVDKVRKEYKEKDYDLDEKLDQVNKLHSNSDHMVKMFEYCSWTKETVSVEDLGTTLPHALDLPPEVISGTLQEVIEFVREEDPEEYQGIRYINSLKEVPEVLDEFLTIVISPGKIIRRQDRMNKVHGEKDWNIKETWGAVHDANHRTVAKILANDLEEIECYVGRPSTDKIYEHVRLDEK
ncbi:MAG: hypothetical protein ABEK16_06490 [Candidatus Nanohalobium sp.]